ncbi:TonB-dependent receptor, partial [uncultured Phenylobacterium sp.]|uniref:TonB-dependent receptor n=1 Tax=uncultured Phenylobacterium sp. TaxID=349273 RepID=UPI0025D90A62
QELVVTAQKREENIRDVGMSIQAESGDRLNKLGIRDTNDLQKIVPGFQASPTYYGTYVFTIRGVGFQDTSLAGLPTVSVYLDETPLTFSALTNGATLDLERVEVLKGPQGTVFGNNATGGAINYIARKPTDHFTAGADVSYGRFNDADIMAFVSGPISDTLSYRVSARINQSGEWQKAYFSRKGEPFGGKDFLNGRVMLQWQPTDNFRANLSVNAWQDQGWSQLGQLYGIAVLSPLAPLAPAIRDYPLAPRNNRAADSNVCVNNSPFNPIANQELGTLLPNQNPTLINPPPLSQGPGSVAQAGGQPTSCQPARKDNSFIGTALRLEYDLGNDMTLTSLSSAQSFSRKQAIDGAGMAIADYQSLQHGKIETFFQEIRLNGSFGGKGAWLIGGNYEYTETWDQFLQSYNASTASPTLFAFNAELGVNFGFPLGPTKPTNVQETDTYAAYAHVEYPVLENLIAVGGIRYTEYSKLGGVCGNDSGDGSWAYVAFQLQILAFNSPSPVLSPPNSCASTGPGPTFNSPPNGQLFYSRLKEDNLSWQGGLNWKFSQDQLAYVNISKGYKAGSFPTVALSTFQQTRPVVQEALLSYEVGAKLLLMERTLQLNGAMFYYDYTNKQILGAISDVVFGALPALVNVPKSRVLGFELSAVYAPDWLEGLTVRPSVSYQDTKILRSGKNTCAPPPAQSDPTVPGLVTCIPGNYYNFDAYSQYADFTGQKFPLAPKWQGSVDAEYRWSLNDQMTAFAGGSVQFVTKTNNFFVNETPIPAFRNAGISGVFPIFGGFVTCAGTPSPAAVGPCPTNHPNDPLKLKGYALVDLRAGVDGGAWTAQAWMRNATNKHYWTSAVHVNDVLLRYTGMPRTYGVTLTYRFE